MSTPRSRSPHSHQAAFRVVSRSGPISASRPPAASPFLDRTSHAYCSSSRQAPASQCSAVALNPDGPRSYHGRISHPGVRQLRAWKIHTKGLGATLRVTLLPEDSPTSTALSAGDSLISLARPFWCTGKRGPVHCQ